jgi:hypothetical protein
MKLNEQITSLKRWYETGKSRRQVKIFKMIKDKYLFIPLTHDDYVHS